MSITINFLSKTQDDPKVRFIQKDDPIMIARAFFLYLLILFGFYDLSAQHIEGTVTDAEGSPLPFVNILINGDQYRGSTTDIDGKFTTTLLSTDSILVFRYIGFESLTVRPDSVSKLNVVMYPTNLGLPEVVVRAGENPAHRIIRLAVANRQRNHPEYLDSYQCRRYHKLTLEYVPDRPLFEALYQKRDTAKEKNRRAFLRLGKIMDGAVEKKLMVLETISNSYFQAPGRITEEVLHNRVSGFEDPTFVAIANTIQPFSFYDEQLTFLEQDYLNPVSRGSTQKYFFQWQDTLFQGGDTIFVISFQPRKGKSFNGLKGILQIHSRHYAIQNVIAEPGDSSMVQLRIEQQYQYTDSGHWFPEQLNFEILLPSYPAKYIGLKAQGKSYLSDVQINPAIDPEVFRSNELVTKRPDANQGADTILDRYRPDPLGPREVATYRFMDSLGQEKKFDKRIRQLEALAEGRWPVGPTDLDLPRLLAANSYENYRLGIGLLTGRSLSSKLELGAYTGYGLADSTWKYGGHLRLRLDEAKNFDLVFSYSKDIKEPAQARYPFHQNLVSSRFFADRMSREEQYSIQVSRLLGYHLEMGIAANRQHLTPLFDYQFTGEGRIAGRSTFTVSQLEWNLQYAYGRKYIRILGQRFPTETPYPVLSLSYRLGVEGALGGQFKYHQLLASLQQQLQGTNGNTFGYRLEAGWTDRSIPYPFLFGSSGIGKDFQLFILDNQFQVMQEYEFLSDRFVYLFLRYTFGTPLYRSRFSQPQLAFAQQIGWGGLRKPEVHEGIAFSTLEKGYYESGLILRNILRINYLNAMYLGLGGGIYYRYGPLQLEKGLDNLAYRMRIDIGF